jgi:hypothetical protein
MTAVYQRFVLIVSRGIMTAVYHRSVLIISRGIMTVCLLIFCEKRSTQDVNRQLS